MQQKRATVVVLVFSTIDRSIDVRHMLITLNLQLVRAGQHSEGRLVDVRHRVARDGRRQMKLVESEWA